MFVRKKINKSGSVSVVVVDKSRGFREVTTIGVSSDELEIARMVERGRRWIAEYGGQRGIDFEGIEASEEEAAMRFLDNVEGVFINGTRLVLERVFARIGFNEIGDEVLRHLVISRLTFPSSKAATVEYLKAYFNEDVELNRIYRYLDRLSDTEKARVQEISVRHTMRILGGSLRALFYDVTTLYFETDHEDDLRRTGFSKEGRHHNPQVILGLLVSVEAIRLPTPCRRATSTRGAR